MSPRVLTAPCATGAGAPHRKKSQVPNPKGQINPKSFEGVKREGGSAFDPFSPSRLLRFIWDLAPGIWNFSAPSGARRLCQTPWGALFRKAAPGVSQKRPTIHPLREFRYTL